MPVKKDLSGTRGRRALMLLAASSLLSWHSVAAAVAANSGWSTVQNLTAIFTKWDGKPENQQVNQAAAKYINYNLMAQRALGSAQWGKITAQQKTKFVASLERLMEERYYVRWHRIFSKGKLTFVSETPSGGDSLVKTNLLVGKKTDNVVWRLKSGETKIVSLAVEDKDLLELLSKRLQTRLKRSGFDALITWMDSRARSGVAEKPSDETSSVAGDSE